MSVASYLGCGCAILSDGGREYCPTCAAKLEQPLPPAPELREEVAKIILAYENREWCDEDEQEVWEDMTQPMRGSLLDTADEIIPLFQFAQAEAVRQDRNKIILFGNRWVSLNMDAIGYVSFEEFWESLKVELKKDWQALSNEGK